MEEEKKKQEWKRPMTVYDAGIVPTFVDTDGYETVILNGEKRKVHILIAEEHVPNPEGKKYIIHKDGDKLNNEAENLEWSDVPEGE